MKKIIALLLASVVAFSAVAEESKYSNYIGAGLNGLFSNLKVDDDGSRSSLGGGANFSILGVNNLSGLTVKVDFTLGASSTKDIPAEDRLTGLFGALDAGFGYSFIHNEDTVLSLLGIISASSSSYNGEVESKIGDVKLEDESITISTVGIGADLTFVQRISGNLHFFASANARYIWTGSEDRKLSGEVDDVEYYNGISRNVTGIIEVVPTLGVMWKIR